MATPTTLPAAFVSGAILTAAQQNSLRGAFRVLQLVQFTYATVSTHNSTTYSATGLTGAITPSATSSQILVMAFVNGTVKGAENAANALSLEIKRGSTQIQEVRDLHFTNSAVRNDGTCFMQVLDSPAAIVSTTYTVNGKNAVAASTIATQFNNTKSVLILAEISA